jgi:predicted PurR-regulated permease PerM
LDHLRDARLTRGSSQAATSAVVVLAVLGVMVALHQMKIILVPVAFALLLACLLYPATQVLRRTLRLSATGAAVVLFLLLATGGLHLSTLAAGGLIDATRDLPDDAEQLSGRLSRRVNNLVKEHPYLKGVLPEPETIDILGERNRRFLVTSLSDRLADVSGVVVMGLVVLILVLFLLAESEMLAPKVVRFFARAPGDARAAELALANLTRQIRAYLVARTLINIGLGIVVGIVLWALKVRFPFALGAFASVTNFVPYVGQFVGGALPVLVTLGQSEAFGDALIVAAAYLAIIGVEGYVVTPYVMGRSLDLNGTTVLLACLLWGFLWGLVGLVLAIPITVCMKLVFQHFPSLHRWAELMSLHWQPPAPPRPIEIPSQTDEIESSSRTPAPVA